jgi:hypothetical protein
MECGKSSMPDCFTYKITSTTCRMIVLVVCVCVYVHGGDDSFDWVIGLLILIPLVMTNCQVAARWSVSGSMRIAFKCYVIGF